MEFQQGMCDPAATAKGVELDTQARPDGLSFMFAAGKRPTADDVARLLVSPEMAGAAARISFRPADDAEGWVELLASGLTFDLVGLAPGDPAPGPPEGSRYGLGPAREGQELEAVTLNPGQHIQGGRAMMPVVRAMSALAASIALPLSVEAVCWHPARSWMEPQYYARIVLNWLADGAFPALGLTSVRDMGDGGIASEGLAYFIGQEIQVESRKGEARSDTVKLAVRLIDYMIRSGPLKAPRELEGPRGESLRAETSASGKTVWVWRDA